MSLDFSVEKLLKQSENSCVYLIRNRDSGHRYIYREYVGSSEVYEKLQNVSCSYLPKIFAVEKHDEKTCVIEEYVQGDTLAFILEEGKLPFSYVLDIAVQICCALEALHSINAVHRDIKPENIILRGDSAFLIDFDASRINKANMSNDTMVMGTTGYAAPEQYGFAQTDCRADIYAFGVMLNEMLTNRHPSQKIADGCLRPIIEKCIEINVNNRYENALELKTALENCENRNKSTITKKKHYITLASIIICTLIIMFFSFLLYNKNLSDINAQLIQSKEKISSLQSELIQKEMAIVIAENQSEQFNPEIQISEELWQGELDVYSTPFNYDIDRDGTEEECHFGAWFGRMYMGELTYIEHNGVTEELGCPMEIFPAVWKIASDGTPALLYNPIYNIENPKVEIWRVSEWGESIPPKVVPLDNIWKSGIKILFTTENTGTYIFRVTGEINGEKLSGQAIVEILLDE